MVHQKVPKLFFQSQFSMSKINKNEQKIRWQKPKRLMKNFGLGLLTNYSNHSIKRTSRLSTYIL